MKTDDIDQLTLRIQKKKKKDEIYLCKISKNVLSQLYYIKNQLMQLCMARTAWSRLCGPCIAAIAGD